MSPAVWELGKKLTHFQTAHAGSICKVKNVAYNFLFKSVSNMNNLVLRMTQHHSNDLEKKKHIKKNVLNIKIDHKGKYTHTSLQSGKRASVD